MTSLQVTRLFEGQEYWFRVAAENEAGRGKYCETSAATTARLPYGKIQQLKGTGYSQPFSGG